MSQPLLSSHFESRQPSPIRLAQIEFARRSDDTASINVAIGNVSLPMHPAMFRRMSALAAHDSPFCDGVVSYTPTVGRQETIDAFMNVIASSGFDTSELLAQITDGGSQAMELVVVGVCGPAGSTERPLLLIDAAYTNYKAFATRLGRPMVSIRRTLQDNGKFTLPSLPEIEAVIRRERPGAMVVIPYDNPTGHCYDRPTLVRLAELCVEHNMWLISDEAYRELHYTGEPAVSVWGLTEKDVPGITGRRISIETASKVWNACGLRIGALVTDNQRFSVQAVAENTASLSSNSIGQYIFGALASEPHESLRAWYEECRTYYQAMMVSFTARMKKLLPKVVVSSPDASIYSVVDVRALVEPGFDATDFVLYCATRGKVDVDGKPMTLLTAPMADFYSAQPGIDNPGRTQMRVAYVEPPDRMRRVPDLFAALLEQYQAQR